MSFNGSGTFVINTAGQPVVANTVISATVFNALTSDLATGLSTCITKDGQTTVTANIPFGNNKITSLGAGTAATDASNMSQVQSTAAKLITVTGTDTITGTMSPALASYAAGQLFYFIANAANTGAMTINIDGLGAKSITRDGSTALIAGDVNTGEIVVICYDGTRFQMINAANSFGNTTINGTLTVTGNTGLQANVSITSALSVGGVFAVTGAATLGSTLAVTGKSDLPTVSTASMNAAVAVVTTGTVTNLTSTSASIASMNAGVALLTNATVTTLTATGASIASANIGNLQFTAASIASINAGVAVITNLTATSASIASVNAGVALLTTATITGLTATGASIASANAGTATLSGNLTLNGGTANGVLYLNASKVATSGSALTFDGTNFATSGSINAGNAKFLAFSASAPSTSNFALYGDTSTTVLNGPSAGVVQFNINNVEQMRLTTTGLGIGTNSPSTQLQIAGASFAIMRLSAASNNVARVDFGTLASPDVGRIGYDNATNGFTFRTNGADVLTLNSSGNLGLGVTPSAWSSAYNAFSIGQGGQFAGGANNTQIHLSANLVFTGTGATSWKLPYNVAGSTYEQYLGAHKWYNAAANGVNGDATLVQAMTLDASGNLLVGTTTTSSLAGAGRGLIEVNGSSDSAFAMKANNTLYGYLYNSASEFRVANVTSNPVTFFTNNTERARFNTTGAFVFAGGTTTADGIGITFPATQSASSNANTLDDYEEGTWTPTISGSTSPGTGGYTTQIGRYTRIGRVVTCQAYIAWTSHTGTGNLYLTGLPFTLDPTTDNHPSATIGLLQNVALTAGNIATAYGAPNSTRFNLIQYPTGGGTITSVPMDTAGEIIYSATYITAT